MPYVDIVSKDDYVSLWYCTSTHNNNVGLFDAEKPTLVILHPAGLDSSWMQPQAEDPRLYNNYNIIMFDTRIAGRSQCRFSGKYDLWVTAADLAQAFYYLHLRPSHIFAADHNCHAALRFAAMFSDLCLSVTLCNVSPPIEIRSASSSIEELNQLWGYAEDLETFEYACREFLEFFGGPHAHPDLQDEIVEYWETYFPPFRRVFSMAMMNVIINRTPLTPKELAAINVPVLIIQSESSPRVPLESAEMLQHELVNVPGGASLFRVKATAGYLSIVCASIVNQVLAKFLSRLSPSDERPSDFRPATESQEAFMRRGLNRLADLKDEPSILNRDPRSSLSFSCCSPELSKAQMEALEGFSKGQRKAFSPLQPDGRPLRKFSDRHDHWLDAGRDGYSRSDISKRIADMVESSKKPSRNGDKRPNENGERNASPLVDDPDAYQVARRRKNNGLTTSALNRPAVKGTMAKVVVSPLQTVLF